MTWLIASPQSRLIHKIAYCEEAKVLRVGLYNNKTRYEYRGVPPELVQELINAEHPGNIFSTKIRDKFETRTQQGGCIDEDIEP